MTKKSEAIIDYLLKSSFYWPKHAERAGTPWIPNSPKFYVPPNISVSLDGRDKSDARNSNLSGDLDDAQRLMSDLNDSLYKALRGNQDYYGPLRNNATLLKSKIKAGQKKYGPEYNRHLAEILTSIIAYHEMKPVLVNSMRAFVMDYVSFLSQCAALTASSDLARRTPLQRE